MFLFYLGEGSYLHLYDVLSGKQLSSVQVFKAAVIHGIKGGKKISRNSSKNDKTYQIKLLIFGQKSIGVIEYCHDSCSW